MFEFYQLNTILYTKGALMSPISQPVELTRQYSGKKYSGPPAVTSFPLPANHWCEKEEYAGSLADLALVKELSFAVEQMEMERQVSVREHAVLQSKGNKVTPAEAVERSALKDSNGQMIRSAEIRRYQIATSSRGLTKAEKVFDDFNTGIRSSRARENSHNCKLPVSDNHLWFLARGFPGAWIPIPGAKITTQPLTHRPLNIHVAKEGGVRRREKH